MSTERRTLAGALVVVATALAVAPLTVAPLAAQGFGFGASVGANLPNGRYADGAKTGLVATGLVELRPTSSLGVRGELFWSRSDIDSPLIRDAGNRTLPAGSYNTSGNVDLIGGIADVVYSFGPPLLRPYLVGGVGVYRRRVAQDISGTAQEFQHLRRSDSNVGYNGGAGLKLSLGPLAAFVEARYHSVSTTPDRTSFVPVTVGVMF